MCLHDWHIHHSHDVVAVPASGQKLIAEFARLKIEHVETLLNEVSTLISSLSLGPLRYDLRPPLLPPHECKELRVTCSQAVLLLGSLLAAHWQTITLAPHESSVHSAAVRAKELLSSVQSSLSALATLQAQLNSLESFKVDESVKREKTGLYEVELVSIPFL